MNVEQFKVRTHNPAIRSEKLYDRVMAYNRKQPLLAYLIVKMDEVIISACIFKTTTGSLFAMRNGYPCTVSVARKYINNAKFERLKASNKQILRQAMLEDL